MSWTKRALEIVQETKCSEKEAWEKLLRYKKLNAQYDRKSKLPSNGRDKSISSEKVDN